jgi:hypothetical protein
MRRELLKPIVTNWVVINLKITLWGSKLVQNVQKCALKKVDGSVFFWSDFIKICPKSDL